MPVPRCDIPFFSKRNITFCLNLTLFSSIQLYWHFEVNSCILVLFSSLVKSNKPRTEQSLKIPSPPQILGFVLKEKKGDKFNSEALTRQNIINSAFAKREIWFFFNILQLSIFVNAKNSPPPLTPNPSFQFHSFN